MFFYVCKCVCTFIYTHFTHIHLGFPLLVLGLATTPEDAVPVLEDYPSSGFDERGSFSAVPCAVCLHVAFK